MTATFIGVFVGSVLLSFLLTRTVRNLANARGWVYAPASSRHIHKDLIPRLGGIAIFIAFSVFALVLVLVPNVLGEGFQRRTVLNILGPAALVFLLGLYDDFRPVQPAVKFAVQAIAGALLYLGGFGIFRLPLFFGSYEFGWLALPLTIIWVLWITNAFNLLDGIDGLAAGSALFSTITVFVVSLVGSNSLVSALTLGLAGAVLGFLRFNFNPATIFLGDCGSLFIGFMLSALALAGAGKTPTIVAVAIPVVSFGLPVLETILSVARRFLSGQPLFEGDSQHIHHKLLERGFSQQKVVLILYIVSAGCGLLSLFLLYPSGPMVGIVLFVIGTGIWVGVQHLGYHEFFELGRVAHRTLEQKKIIVNNVAIRRATAALSKASDIEAIRRALTQGFEANDFDGYELTIGLDAIRGDSDRNGLISWERDAVLDEKQWRLSLDLRRANSGSFGRFELYKSCGESLLVDVNLIISAFNIALSDALERALYAPVLDAAAHWQARESRLLSAIPDSQPGV